MADDKAHAEPLTDQEIIQHFEQANPAAVNRSAILHDSCKGGDSGNGGVFLRDMSLADLIADLEPDDRARREYEHLLAAHATQQAAIRLELEGVLAQLRHAYQQLTAHDERWSRRGMREFADGLIAPQIRKLEKLARLAEPGA